MFQIYYFKSGHFCKLTRACIGGAERTTWRFNDYGEAMHSIHELWNNLDGQFSLVDESLDSVVAINMTELEHDFYNDSKI